MAIPLPPPPPEAELLFIDGEAIVLDKPAGLPVDQPRRGGPSLADWLDALRFGFQRPPQPVHRLDQDTSGCLLLARNPKAMVRFGQAFEQGLARKSYLGVVDAVLKEGEGVIDLPLAKTSSAEAGWRMVPDAKGKAALTRWRALAEVDGRTLVRFQPETGRTHQLRVHAQRGLGAPLLGDPVYGQPHAGGLMLHAEALEVRRTGKPPVIGHAPFPPRLAALGFADPGHG